MRALSYGLVLLLAAACGGGGTMTAATPLRPKAKPLPPKAPEAPPAPPDCDAIRPSEGGPPVVYKDRRIDEGEALASSGLSSLIKAEKPGPIDEKQQLITAAIAKFHQALAVDPYNVKATYNLAAAYGRIGRKQCALNLLARLVEMQSFPSQKSAVDGAFERLMGKGSWKGRPDPDFDGMRADPDFGAIVRKI